MDDLSPARASEILADHAPEAKAGPEGAPISDEARRVDLPFSDVVMPGELNGLALAQVVLRCSPNIRVILTSGFAANINGSADDGVRLLIKPYWTAELARALHDSLRR
jgi:CheY-like chemotaxis protein